MAKARISRYSSLWNLPNDPWDIQKNSSTGVHALHADRLTSRYASKLTCLEDQALTIEVSDWCKPKGQSRKILIWSGIACYPSSGLGQSVSGLSGPCPFVAPSDRLYAKNAEDLGRVGSDTIDGFVTQEHTLGLTVGAGGFG